MLIQPKGVWRKAPYGSANSQSRFFPLAGLCCLSLKGPVLLLTLSCSLSSWILSQIELDGSTEITLTPCPGVPASAAGGPLGRRDVGPGEGRCEREQSMGRRGRGRASWSRSLPPPPHYWWRVGNGCTFPTPPNHSLLRWLKLVEDLPGRSSASCPGREGEVTPCCSQGFGSLPCKITGPGKT